MAQAVRLLRINMRVPAGPRRSHRLSPSFKNGTAVNRSSRAM
jgi:hypothetical protein